VHVQLHQQKGMISLSPPTICNSALAGIFPENQASVALHRSQGFREVGCRENVGEMNGKWRDVLILERRSRTVGC
ncbi:N-acetyltransferase family protein, partial [Klebsiella pneumoniae]|uniref:GNAT family N-acetyltransferase n=1 Tax=Klebsiella pneumoniae TaxID=573 RepID=UPI003AB96A10